MTSYYFTPNEVREGSSDAFRQEIKNPDVYYIVDSFEAAVANAKTILLTSPDNLHWKKVEKASGKFFYMPPWSEVVAEDVAKRNYAKWGGVPRYVLEFGNEEGKQKYIDDAISQCDPEMIWKSVGAEFAKDDTMHRVVHIVPDVTYRKVTLEFASRYVRDQVSLRLFRQHRRQLELFFASNSGVGALGTSRGYLFEDFAHQKLCAGGAFRIRQLGPLTFGNS